MGDLRVSDTPFGRSLYDLHGGVKGMSSIIKNKTMANGKVGDKFQGLLTPRSSIRLVLSYVLDWIVILYVF